MLLVRFKKLHPNAVEPFRAHPTDAGADLTATSKTYDEYGNVVYGTGLAIEIPHGYVGMLFPRSSNCKTDLRLTNAVGILDDGYVGEVMFKFRCCHSKLSLWQRVKSFFSNKPVTYNNYRVGDRIGQLVIVPIPEVNFIEAENLTETDRGTGGYGSSGR